MAAYIVQNHIPNTLFLHFCLPYPRFPSITRIQNVIRCRSNAFSFREMACVPAFSNGILCSGEGRANAFRRHESESSNAPDVMLDERFPFDINLAVVLAGFAFEAYNTPSDASGVHEMDPFDCKTIFLSE